MMSFRKLNKAIILDGVKAVHEGRKLFLNGKYGEKMHMIPDILDISMDNNFLRLGLSTEPAKKDKAMIGTFISLVNSSIIGVKEQHSRKVIFSGTGMSIKIDGQRLAMNIGKSHIVYKDIPKSLNCSVETSNVKRAILQINGIDKQEVTQFASELLTKRAYKGGIHIYLENKEPKLKEGKSA